jgi:hypothetical protein
VRQSRKTLLVTTILLGVVAAAAIATVLFSTLRVSAKTDSELPRISLDDLAPGTWKFATYWEESPQSLGWDMMLVRARDGHLSVWFIPVKQGKRRVPEFYWHRPGNACELKPDFDTGVIACSDPNASDWDRSRSRWALNGKSLSGQSPDMDAVTGSEESGFFVVHKQL